MDNSVQDWLVGNIGWNGNMGNMEPVPSPKMSSVNTSCDDTHGYGLCYQIAEPLLLNLHGNLALNLFLSGSFFFSYVYTRLVPYTSVQYTHMHTIHTHTHTERCVLLTIMFLLNIFKFVHVCIVHFPTRLVPPEKCKENILPPPTSLYILHSYRGSTGSH